MSTKTPEENESDMEAGMTTAERRRRRRRGGGLRVPSDNVPRRISSPAVAPMSEDPSVAIAMAYTGGNGAEAPALASDPIAPEPISTLIDPPGEEVIEEISFESKTREMSAVDLEELGLDGEGPVQARTVSTEIPITYSTVLVDEEMYTEQTPALSAAGAAPTAGHGAPSIAPPANASITGQMGALIGGSPAAAVPPVTPPATPPPIPAAAHHASHHAPRVALTPAASSPAISLPPTAPPPVSTSFAAPQAPSAFGTAPGHPPPPASGFAASASPPAPAAPIAPFTPISSSAAPPAASAGAPSPAAPSVASSVTPSVAPPQAPFTVVSSMPSAGVAPPAAAASPPSATSSATSSATTASVTTSGTGIPIAIAPSPSAPVSLSIAPPASSVATPAAPASAEGHAPSAAPAAGHEAPPPPRVAKGRAQTLALSEDDLEEFLEENRIDLRGDRGDRGDRQQSSSEELGELDVEMEVDSAAVVAAGAEERAPAAAPERVGEAGLGAAERAADRPSDRQLGADRPTERSGEIGLDPGERRERILTPHGVPTVQVAELGRTKSASVPPPMPAAPPAATTSPGAVAAGAPAVSSPSIAPPPASPPGAAAGPAAQPRTAPPPPTPSKPPPAPPKKAPDKRAAAVAAASTGGDDKKPRSKAWFAEVFDEDYLRTLPFLTPQATQAEAELVAASLGVSPGAKLLDVGCGYGRHAMELAARGYHVVGLDLSTPLLVRGGEEAHRRGLTINFIRGDMRELDFDGQFDGAYCLFSTFGYFDDETNKKTAGNIARALRPGGKCVFEILNRDYVIADLPTRVWWEGDGCVVLEEVDFNYFSSRICVNRSVVFDDGRQLEQEISIRAYSLHEVGKLMLAAGFRVLEVSGSYQTRGRFFGNQSRHIIVVAERTG